MALTPYDFFRHFFSFALHESFFENCLNSQRTKSPSQNNGPSSKNAHPSTKKKITNYVFLPCSDRINLDIKYIRLLSDRC